MSTSTARRHPPGRSRSPLSIVLRFAGWEFWRNLRMVDGSFFIVVLPAALYLMFGLTNSVDDIAGRGNVPAYVMTSMAVYGAMMATSSLAGSSAVERSSGWGRQLGMTGLSGTGYLAGKMLMGLAMATLPVAVVLLLGAATGARFDEPWQWLATAGLCVVIAIPFSLYGLAVALLFRSETAVSAGSGLLVVLAFFGNLFLPLSGVMLEIAKFTPLYGVATLARWPLMEGMIIPHEEQISAAAENNTALIPEYDSVGWMLFSVVAWTLIFGVLCLLAGRRRTQR